MAYAWPLAMLVSSVVSILVRLHIPVTVGKSAADSLLFMRLSDSLREGQWLGSFDNLTLAKGPAYPAFIAATYWAHLPLKVGEQLTWLLAALAIAACVWVLTRRVSLAALTYIVLALNPDNFDSQSTDVLREGWYSSLCVLFTALLFLAIWLAVDRHHPAWAMGAGLAAGLSLAAVWLCREEGFALLPVVAVVLIGVPAVRLWRRKPTAERDGPEAQPSRASARADASSGRFLLLRLAAVVLLIGLGTIVPIEYVAQHNKSTYGEALTNDMASGAVNRAYADLMRVHAGPMRRSVPITKAQREAVYAVSPAMREMKVWLDDRPNGWMRQSCPASPTCDYSGAYMVWALRAAAAKNGHFASEPEAQRYFAQISAEIGAACSDKRLSCATRLPASLQTLQRLRPGPFFSSMGRSLFTVTLSSDFSSILPGIIQSKPLDREATVAAVRGVPSTPQAAEEQYDNMKTRLFPIKLVMGLFRWVLPLVVIIGAGWLLLQLVTRRITNPGLALLSAILAVGVLTRLALVAVIAATQWKSRAIRYELPAREFLVVFAVVITVLVADDWLRRREPSSGTDPAPTEVAEPETEQVGAPLPGISAR
ncbi:MAG: hypothetical protein DLM58_18455 [Pseudonocardiales bacterium]|nr:MAG: hypothetical protein DLM58_18455 [Pseudonocardiales bacterium]